MEYDYRGFEISLDIKSTPTTWIVFAEAKRLKEGVVVEALPRLKESFPRAAGALNSLMSIQKTLENKIVQQLI